MGRRWEGKGGEGRKEKWWKGKGREGKEENVEFRHQLLSNLITGMTQGARQTVPGLELHGTNNGGDVEERKPYRRHSGA